MYVGPWQEFKAMERARIAEQHASMAQMAQRRGQPPADQNMADELERLRRALELVSGELPPEAAHKVRTASWRKGIGCRQRPSGRWGHVTCRMTRAPSKRKLCAV